MTSRPSPAEPNASLDSDLFQGIDVSQYQGDGTIDWKAGAEAGFSFVMIRAGYGSKIDPLTQTHVKRARSAGWKLGLYQFPTEAPLDDQWNLLLRQSDLAGIGESDIAPMFDLEWLDGKGKLPTNIPGYLETVRTLIARSRDRWGKAWIYTAPGFWQTLGSPAEWLTWPWMMAKWGAHPPANVPLVWTAWQSGAINPAWSKGPLDHDQARELPIIETPHEAA